MRRTTILLSWTMILALALLSTGCISQFKAKIAAQQDEIGGLQDENAALRDERDRLIAEGENLQDVIAGLEAQIVDLEGKTASLVEYNAALEKEIEKLGGDKAAMQRKYEDSQKVIAQMRKKEAQAKARLRTIKKMLSKFKALIAAGKLNVEIRDGKMMLVLPSAVLFELGRADISKEGKKTLREVGAVLKDIRGREFQVAGHTDNVAITSGRYETNWELSVSRSVAVVRFLQKHGVTPKWLSASGYSQYRPTHRNDTPENKAQNRRIEIILMPDLNELPDLSDLEKELK